LSWPELFALLLIVSMRITRVLRGLQEAATSVAFRSNAAIQALLTGHHQVQGIVMLLLLYLTKHSWTENLDMVTSIWLVRDYSNNVSSMLAKNLKCWCFWNGIFKYTIQLNLSFSTCLLCWLLRLHFEKCFVIICLQYAAM
jgi:hypothetical protein